MFSLEFPFLTSSSLSPEAIKYCELHGSGTLLGDQIELASHASVYSDVVVGSVKSNIGHCGIAAGIAGFIKTVLVLGM